MAWSCIQPRDYDSIDGLALMNEVMADDDAKDPLLQSYQHYGKPT